VTFKSSTWYQSSDVITDYSVTHFRIFTKYMQRPDPVACRIPRVGSQGSLPNPVACRIPAVQRLFDFGLPSFPVDEPWRRVLSHYALTVQSFSSDNGPHPASYPTPSLARIGRWWVVDLLKNVNIFTLYVRHLMTRIRWSLRCIPSSLRSSCDSVCTAPRQFNHPIPNQHL